MNKPVIAFVIAATAGVLVVLQKKSEGPPPVAATKQSSQEALRDGKSQLLSSSPETPNANLSDHKRVAGERTKTAKWHPTEKGKLISPYNHETLAAIGVISGAKMKDADDNTFFVPPFEQSPFPISPAGAPVPGRTGFFFNPFTNEIVDARGIPGDTLIRDPKDTDPDHIFRIPPEGTK